MELINLDRDLESQTDRESQESNVSLNSSDEQLEPGLLNSVKFQKGLFIIIFVAQLLSLFEIAFFLFLVEPQEKTQIINFIENLGSLINGGSSSSSSSSSSYSKNYNSEYEYILHRLNISSIKTNNNNLLYNSLVVLNLREDELNDQINNYAIFLMVLIIIILLIFLIVLFIRLRNLRRTILPTDTDINRNTDIDDEIKAGFLTGLLTIVIIGLIQYNMYQFGLRFQYPGPNEILNVINTYVINSINSTNSTG